MKIKSSENIEKIPEYGVKNSSNCFICDSRLVVFTSVKGGCGCSFIANSVSCAMTRSKNKNILLIDTNSGRKDSRIIFNISENIIRDMGDIKDELSELDVSLLKKIIINFENSFNIILPSLKFEKTIMDFGSFSNLVGLLLKIYDLVLMDLPQYYYLGENEKLFDLADKIIIVSGPDNVSISNLETMLGNISEPDNENKIDIIINKFNLKPFISSHGLVNSTGLPVKLFIPYDRDIEYIYNSKGPFFMLNYNLRTVKAIISYSENIFNELF